MNDNLKVLFDKIVSMGKDDFLKYVTTGDALWFENDSDELALSLSKLQVIEVVQLLKEVCKNKGIEIESLGGGGGAVVEEEDTSKLYQIMIKGFTPEIAAATSKTSTIIGLSKLITGNPEWTLGSVKTKVTNLATAGTAFAYPKTAPKADLEPELQKISACGVICEIKVAS